MHKGVWQSGGILNKKNGGDQKYNSIFHQQGYDYFVLL